MPLIVENGTGVVGANSYGTVAQADAFFADRNILNWAGVGATTAQKEGYLIQAADYLNQFYIPKGEQAFETQSMGLPTLVYDYVPLVFRHAQFILAREAVKGPLSTPLGSRLITSERKKLEGVGEKEVTYERTNADEFGNVGAAIGRMLYAYIKNTASIQYARVDYS